MKSKDAETVRRIQELEKLILQLQQFQCYGTGNDSDEQDSVINSYRQLIINLKYQSKGLVNWEIESLIAKIKPEEFHQIYDIYEAKSSVDSMLPLITKIITDKHLDMAFPSSMKMEPVDAQAHQYELVKQIYKNTKETGKTIEECKPHLKSIPAYVEKANEALANPLTAADDARRQMPLTRPEHEIRDAIIQYGSQKQAAIALKLSEASVSRASKEIRRKMRAAGFSDSIVFRPSKGFKKVGNDFVTTEKEVCLNEDPEDDQF